MCFFDSVCWFGRPFSGPKAAVSALLIQEEAFRTGAIDSAPSLLAPAASVLTEKTKCKTLQGMLYMQKRPSECTSASFHTHFACSLK